VKWLACTIVFLLASTAHAYIDKSKIGWDQHVGAQLPLDLQFDGARGQPVRLRDLFDDKPVALAFVYFSCPELCPEVLTGIQQAFNQAGLNAGRDYKLVAVSIDPHDSSHNAADRLRHLGSANDNIQLLTTAGDNAALLAHVAGFRNLYDREHQQYAHPAGFLIATPDGRISRYFFGVRYDADELRSAIAAARRGGVSNIVRQVLLVCFHFDPTLGPYSAAIMIALRAVSITMLTLTGLWIGIRIHRRKPV
jgi:protein SCO1